MGFQKQMTWLGYTFVVLSWQEAKFISCFLQFNSYKLLQNTQKYRDSNRTPCMAGNLEVRMYPRPVINLHLQCIYLQTFRW